MKTTNNVSADVIIETGGAETLYKSLDCIAFGGFYKQHQVRPVVECVWFSGGKGRFQVPCERIALWQGCCQVRVEGCLLE